NRLFRPGLAGLFEFTDQLFLLRVYADRGLTGALKPGDLLFNIFELLVAVRMLCPRFFLFCVHTRRIVVFPQQPSDGWQARTMSPGTELIGQFAETDT